MHACTHAHISMHAGMGTCNLHSDSAYRTSHGQSHDVDRAEQRRGFTLEARPADKNGEEKLSPKEQGNCKGLTQTGPH
jgi:hypothetical protein